MAFIDEIKAKAKSNKKTVILPESMDRRTFEAAAEILAEDIANLIIIGTDEEVKANSEGLDISKATIINPHTYEKTQEYINGFYELRKAKGMTPEEAEKTLLGDYMYYRPSLQIIKTAPGTKLVSAFFVMVVPNCEYGEDGVFVFGDCGLVQNPNPEELAAIAGSSAASFKQLVGKEPVVALLSHSSMGSAKHDDVTKVVEATKIAKEEYPQFAIDGELQADAAMVPSIGASKAPDSKVAGKANVLIFPDLDAGNIGYKLVQRLAKAEAYGPMCQGIAKPVNDLSRGCSAKDIVGVIAITAVQAQNS